MVDTHAAVRANLLAEILANPDDDTPRLILADWLQDNWESERAELIRVQIEQAGSGLADVRRAYLEGRERYLLGRHGADWLPRPPAGYRAFYTVYPYDSPGNDEGGWAPDKGPATAVTCVRTIFRRGFVEEAALSWEDWARHHAALTLAQPIRVVRLTTPVPYEVCGVGRPMETSDAVEVRVWIGATPHLLWINLPPSMNPEVRMREAVNRLVRQRWSGRPGGGIAFHFHDEEPDRLL